MTPDPSTPFFRRGATLALIAWLVSGCASPQQSRGPKHAQPANVVPTQMVASVGPFEDTNANGYPDSATVTVYVFSDAYPEASVMVPATLTFRLVGKSGAVVREWRFDERTAKALVRRGPVGLGYVVRLSLLQDNGSDETPEPRGELSVIYTTPQGVTLTSIPEAVRIGRTGP